MPAQRGRSPAREAWRAPAATPGGAGRSRYFVGYLSESGAQHVRAYKYAGGDDSLILKYVTNPIYERLVLLFPTWLAPNIITLAGLCCTASTYVLFHHYCPFLYGVAPWWAYVLNAMSILAYQGLDAMDGKQARRTGSGSALGLLFDHGCDAFNGTIMSLTMCSVAQMGPGLVSFTMWMSATAVFLSATIEEFYTGEMRLGVINGPNEGLMIAVVSNLVTVVIGPHFWNASSPFLGMPWNKALLALTILCGFVTKIDNWCRIFGAIWSKRRTACLRWRVYPELGKFNYFVAMSRFAPFLLLCFGTFVWIAISPSNIMQRHPRAMSWVMGFLFSKLATMLMLSHITDDEYHPMGRTYWLVVGVGFQFVVSCCFSDVNCWDVVSLQALRGAWQGGRDYNMQGMPSEAVREPVSTMFTLFVQPPVWTQEDFLLYELLVITGVSYFHYVFRIVLEVSGALNVSVFSIPYPNKATKPAGQRSKD